MNHLNLPDTVYAQARRDAQQLIAAVREGTAAPILRLLPWQRVEAVVTVLAAAIPEDKSLRELLEYNPSPEPNILTAWRRNLTDKECRAHRTAYEWRGIRTWQATEGRREYYRRRQHKDRKEAS